jgi:hypothetical protein
MESFNFTSAMLDEGITFIFGLWVCVADSAGSIRRHLVNDIKLEASAASQRSSLDKFINNLDETLLPNIAREIEEESVFNATSTRTAPGLRSDMIRSEDLHTRLPFELRKMATVHQKAMRFETLSTLEEDLDRLLKIGNDCSDYTRKLPARIMLLLL